MKNIFPIRDIQQNASCVLREVNRSDEPVIITQRGEAMAVLLSPERFEMIENDLERLKKLRSDLGMPMAPATAKTLG